MENTKVKVVHHQLFDLFASSRKLILFLSLLIFKITIVCFKFLNSTNQRLFHTKSLLKAGFTDGFDNIVLRKILQEPLFVPETIFVDDLLKELRNSQRQMAILLDEYGGMAGLVTLEDLLEEIVGEIDDETDRAEVYVHTIGEDTHIVQGTMNLNDFNDYFDVVLESDDVDTIAGYYLTGVGTIPSMSTR